MEIWEKACDIVSDAKESVSDYFLEDTITSRKKLLTLGTICVLIGIITGFLFSPIKKGIYINISDNGNYVPQKKEDACSCQNNKKKGRK